MGDLGRCLSWEDPLEKVSNFFILFDLFREEIDILRIEFIDYFSFCHPDYIYV